MNTLKTDQYLSSNEIVIEEFNIESEPIRSFTAVDYLHIQISQVCQNISEQFIHDDVSAYFNEFQALINIIMPSIDEIHYLRKENSLIQEFKTISFDKIILQVCQNICNQLSDFSNEVAIIISMIDVVTNLDCGYFSNEYILPFFENILKVDQNVQFIPSISRIIGRILPSQIKFDNDFHNFSQYFCMIIDSPIEFHLKVAMLESLINSGVNMEFYFDRLLPHLSFFLEMNRATHEEIRIFTQLLNLNSSILPFLFENGFIPHIIQSITEYSEGINLDIVNFAILIYTIDNSIHDALNIDQICYNYLNDENEEYQIAALTYFSLLPVPSLGGLLEDEDNVDLIWAIISDGFFVDSTLKLKIASIRFLYKLLQCHNDHFMSCLLDSNVCEICELLLNLDDKEITLLCIDILMIVFNVSKHDEGLAQKFIDEYSQTDINNIFADNSDCEIEIKAKEFIESITAFYK